MKVCVLAFALFISTAHAADAYFCRSLSTPDGGAFKNYEKYAFNSIVVDGFNISSRTLIQETVANGNLKPINVELGRFKIEDIIGGFQVTFENETFRIFTKGNDLVKRVTFSSRDTHAPFGVATFSQDVGCTRNESQLSTLKIFRPVRL